MGVLSEHDIDFATAYCRRCGAGAHQVTDRQLACLPTDTDNVIAVSHIISARRWAQMLGQSGIWGVPTNAFLRARVHREDP